MSEVLEERLRALDKRVESVEAVLKAQEDKYVQILVKLEVLQTRVSLYAAAISFAVTAGLGALQKFL